MLRRRDLEQIQRDTGFSFDMLEKLYHLSRVPWAICQSKELYGNLTLKGGTALNLMYLDVPRLSIDLDFNFTGSVERDQMKTLRQGVETAIDKTGRSIGYEVTAGPSSYIMSRYRLRYTTLREIKDHIRVEVNYLDRLPIGQIVERTFPTFFPDLQQFPVRTYTLEELAAQKTKAFIEREDPPDLYDLYRLSMQRVDPEETRKCAVIYYCMTDGTRNPDEIIQAARTYDDKRLLPGIRQFIRTIDRVDPHTVRCGATSFLQGALAFKGKERQSVDTFYREHRIIPDLVWDNKSEIARHPSLLHRLYTLREA